MKLKFLSPHQIIPRCEQGRIWCGDLFLLSLFLISALLAGCQTTQEAATTTITTTTTTSTTSTTTTITTSTSTTTTILSTSTEFKFIRKIEVANAGYPTIIFTNHHFYVSYEWSGGCIYLRKYDENFTPSGEVQQLTTAEGADHQMVYGDSYFYLVNSFYLRKFDSEWNKIKSVSVLDNLPPETSQYLSKEVAEGLDDMLLYYTDGSIYVGMIGNLPHGDKGEKLDIPENLFIREYDQNLELKNEVMLENVGNPPASSMLLQNGTFTLVCSDRKWNDSSLIAVRYDQNWNLTGRTTISAVADANEEFPMGFLYENGYYVSYNHITGDLSQPAEKEPIKRQDIMLKAFDSNWNLAGQTIITSDVPASNTTLMANAAHLAIAGNKIYVAYDSSETGSAKVFVKEYEIIKN